MSHRDPGRLGVRGSSLNAILDSRAASCHSVPLAQARPFRAASNAQKRTPGSNSDQLTYGFDQRVFRSGQFSESATMGFPS